MDLDFEVCRKSADGVGSINCTHEDKTGEGPSGSSMYLAHRDFMAEMGRSVFCLVIPGETQNTPRLTEAMLSGTRHSCVLSWGSDCSIVSP